MGNDRRLIRELALQIGVKPYYTLSLHLQNTT